MFLLRVACWAAYVAIFLFLYVCSVGHKGIRHRCRWTFLRKRPRLIDHLTSRAHGLAIRPAPALLFPTSFDSLKGAKIFRMFTQFVTYFPPPIKYNKNRTVCFCPSPLKRASNTHFSVVSLKRVEYIINLNHPPIQKNPECCTDLLRECRFF
uniref:Uncharacterized protein n=1 Tax=Gallus gallus TaxID=9031 RepID=A0A8V0X8V1_CHICK